MLLDFAEDQTKQRKNIYMKDWHERVDAFLEFHGRSILNNTGKITHTEAENIVYERYEKFELSRRDKKQLEAENEAIDELKLIDKKFLIRRINI